VAAGGARRARRAGVTAPAWSPGGMIRASAAYQRGWAYAEAELANESREVREAAARNMARAQSAERRGSEPYQALSGGLAYLTERHEGDR